METVLERPATLRGDHTHNLRADIRSRKASEQLQDPRVLRKLLRSAGYDLGELDPALRQRALPSIRGGATGAGGVSFLSNLPPDNYQMNPALFEQSTERQDIPQAQVPFNGFGSTSSFVLQQVGVVALVRLYFTGTLVVGGTGAVTSYPGFPHSLAANVTLNANGQTKIISVRGTTLRARRQRIFRNATETITSSAGVPAGTISNGSYPIAFMLDVPISHDMFSGTGWLLAQNPSTTLSVDVSWANQADVFSIAAGGTVALTGSTQWEVTSFAVGQAMAGNTAVTVIPDLTVFHGMLDKPTSFAAAGTLQAPLIRTAGQLTAYSANLRNGPGAEISPAALTSIKFRYGGNRIPRDFNPPQMLLQKNMDDYNGLVVVNGLTYTFFDFEVDNPTRDLFLPESLVELQAQFDIPTSVTVNSGAYLLSMQESLYPAVG